MRIRGRVSRVERPDSTSAVAAVLPWMAGAAAGLVAGWWLGRSSAAAETAVGEVDEGWADRWGERMDAAMEAAADGFRRVERRWREARPLDEALLQRTLAAVPGAGSVRVRMLGAGLVEMAGEASDAAVEEARAAVAAVPGVRVVVSRVWTPSSAEPGQIDAPTGFG